ncbi:MULTISPECIES: short chain dehydrogenase [Brevibacterium]|uniref:NAD(P)-dependent dehydrogenase, short-chain alcohol dehydrogenase family n=1 Tax=Brevibacterium aurantiacum TaxID=273384 RepID=A0A2A3YTV7_BREAU|nr:MULTISPECIES: short chain dehydrogenase [Brevibacterium]MDN5549272.1 short chain dehydrogenase [Brevibacterium sp.]AZL07015.1 short chain dehydrogenase [Brevibacterium aurantiacum]AZL10618.1 short chain dehydrogenase [Brevibacterium aurantiacum]AZL14258.1 short chain dehydrogenase [Brevibacterium aurantiacum]AZT94838.1 short chain dehydrogenase [Brevibacterium aurantiacum]
MKILVVGAAGHVGGVARAELETRGHQVIAASRSTDPGVDTSDPESIAALLKAVGRVDAIVVAVGAAAFKPVTELSREDYLEAFTSKALGQVEFVTQGLDYLNDGGSITVTTGVLSREPVPTAAAAALVNGAVESFVISAAPELPRGIRINAVSPNVLANSPHFHDAFAGMVPVTDEQVAAAFVRSVEGNVTGRVLSV